MKNYLTEWKKWKSVLKEDVKAAQEALRMAQKEEEAINNYTKMLTDQAAQKLQMAQKAIELAQAEEASKGTSANATMGTTGTTGLRTENAAGERDDGAMGKQPGDFPDVPNANMEEELTEEELEEACGQHQGIDESGKSCNLELEYKEIEQTETCNECRNCTLTNLLTEAKYKGRKVTLNKPMRGDVKKFKVFVRDPSTGNIKKVNFGDKNMRIKKSNPKRRKSFRARHRCENPGPKTKARYWSCRKW